MEPILFTTEMWIVSGILFLTLFLLISEILRLDIAALLILVLIGLLGLVDTKEIFFGFSSNAVIAIMATMIIASSLEKTGFMQYLARKIQRIAGKSEKRVLSIFFASSGILAGFIQNIGAVTLLFPVIKRVSNVARVPASRILLPMAFASIIGGVLTMVGSVPLILLNDLISQANENLPPGTPLIQTFSLFSTFPIGIIILLLAGVFFLLWGKHILPEQKGENADEAQNALQYFHEVYGTGTFFEASIKEPHPWIGKNFDTIYALDEERPMIVGCYDRHRDIRLAPARDGIIAPGRLALMGEEKNIKKFCKKYNIDLKPELEFFAEALSPITSGVREVIVPPGARSIIGKTFREVGIPTNANFSILRFYRGDQKIDKLQVVDTPLQIGDSLLLHGSWHDFAMIKNQTRFLVAGDIPHEEIIPQKLPLAITFFILALALVLFSGATIPLTNFTIPHYPISFALMIGALGMLITNILPMQDAYRAINWKTIFVIASILPLGVAVSESGLPSVIATGLLHVFGEMPIWGYHLLIAIFSTIFSVMMAGGATVILVPMAIGIALQVGGDPAQFALIAALCACNALMLPSHSVNLLVMGPGGYSSKDYFLSGSIISAIFIVVVVAMINLIY